jgi:ferrous iron transport protein A
MRLDELEIEQKAIIKSIDANSTLAHRLASFGIVRGEEITIKSVSLGKQTIEIEVENTLIALRNEEAHKIEIELID